MNSPVGAVDIVNRQDRQIAIIAEVAEGQAGARLDIGLGDEFLRHIEGDGHREDIAIRQTAVGDDPN